MNGYSFDVTPTEVKDKALLLPGYLYGHKHLCPLSGQKENSYKLHLMCTMRKEGPQLAGHCGQSKPISHFAFIPGLPTSERAIRSP